MPLLSELIHSVTETIDLPLDAASLPVTGITSDSRQVAPGMVFVALKGDAVDGEQFIPEAIRKGAAAVISSSHYRGEGTVLRSNNTRLALAQLAAAFYPRQPQIIVAVTGTDGKTSTADFTRQLWALMGYKAASIGTLGTLGEQGQALYPGTHTTPDPVSLHKMLQELHDAGYTHVAMEASSHGLDQYRLHGVRVAAAAFTNLTRDHLDYHKTEEAYFAAKAKLFAEFPIKTAVLNADDARFGELKKICKARVIGFGKNGHEFQLRSLDLLSQGQQLEMSCFGKDHTLSLPLVGAFQAMNILTALGLIAGSGGDVEKAMAMVPKLKGVPGRLEQVATLANGAAVYIDYAHTPAALANILRTLRPHTQGKLHVVFGCGGDRDAGKRPEMGKAASELADHVIVTDDNPRGEDPSFIRRSVMEASTGAREIAGRKEAIHAAVAALLPGDVLVIAGKGHEKTQIIGGKTFPFDDAEVAREAVKNL